MKLCEAGEWLGKWWVPEDPEFQLPGILKYDGAGHLELVVAGSFTVRRQELEHPNVIYTGGEEPFDTIWGTCCGHKFTLCAASLSGHRSELKPSEERFAPEKAIRGTHINDPNSKVFHTVRASFENLHLLAANSKISGIDKQPDHLWDRTTVDLHCSAQSGPKLVNFLVSNHLSKTQTLAGSLTRKRTLVYEIELCDDRGLTLTEAIRQLQYLREVVCFATQSRAGVIQVELDAAAENEVIKSEGQKIEEVGLLYRCPHIGRPEEPAGRKGLFDCSDVDFEQLISNWFQHYNEFSNSMKLLTSLISDRGGYIEQRVITAVTAAEALSYGRTKIPKPFAKDEFDELRKTLLQAVKPKYRSWVKRRLRNQPDLKDRLVALIQPLDKSVVTALLPDPHVWARKAVKTRNELAHVGKAREFDAIELYVIARYTTVLVSLVIADRLGVPVAVQKEFSEGQRNPEWDTYFTEARQPSASES